MKNNNINTKNICKKGEKFFKSPKNIFKLILGALDLLGILQYSAILPILDEINFPHDFEINVSEPKIIKFPVQFSKEILTEKDYNNFLVHNSNEIFDGIYTSTFTDSSYVEIAVSIKINLIFLIV